jgi:hypothetical protein
MSTFLKCHFKMTILDLGLIKKAIFKGSATDGLFTAFD